MIYRVTLPNGETLHTGHGPLADVWLNRHGGKLERIPLANIKSVAAEMWDGSQLTAALISVDRLRAILNDKNEQMDAMAQAVGMDWRGDNVHAFHRALTAHIARVSESARVQAMAGALRQIARSINEVADDPALNLPQADARF